MVGPEGERWVPIHGVLKFSQVLNAYKAIQDFFVERQNEMEQHGIVVAYLMALTGSSGFLLEPVFYWQDELQEFHQRCLPKSHLKKLTPFGENLEARQKVTQWKQDVSQLLDNFGATHFQIGKFYAYTERLDQTTVSLLNAIKMQLDPEGLINPGALGIPK